MRVILLDPLLRDAFLATLMNWAILWVCTRILRLKPRWAWMIIAAVLGGVYQLSLGIRWQLGYVSRLDWIFFLGVGGFIAWLASPSRHLTQIIRRIFLFYFLTFLTVGVSMGVRSLLQLIGTGRLSPWHYFLINMSSLLIVAELGWGMIQEAVWTRAHLVKVHIQLGPSHLYLHGLVDTGNLMRDPFTQIPVVVISFPAVRTCLPEEVVQIIEQLMAGDMPSSRLAGYWENRIKILPFTSVGNSKGLMVGLTAEQLDIAAPSSLSVKPAVLGFTIQSFSSGDYQAIVPAALYDQVLSV